MHLNVHGIPFVLELVSVAEQDGLNLMVSSEDMFSYDEGHMQIQFL